MNGPMRAASVELQGALLVERHWLVNSGQSGMTHPDVVRVYDDVSVR